jgi:hypothetical protein
MMKSKLYAGAMLTIAAVLILGPVLVEGACRAGICKAKWS